MTQSNIHRKIQDIKYLRERFPLGLREAKDLVERIYIESDRYYVKVTAFGDENLHFHTEYAALNVARAIEMDMNYVCTVVKEERNDPRP